MLVKSWEVFIWHSGVVECSHVMSEHRLSLVRMTSSGTTGTPGVWRCRGVAAPRNNIHLYTGDTESQSHIRETRKLQHIELQGSRWQWIQNILTAMTIFHCNSLDITLILWWCSIWKLNKHQDCQSRNSFQVSNTFSELVDYELELNPWSMAMDTC